MDIKAQQQLKKLIEEVNLVADRAQQISRELSSPDFLKGNPDLVSQIDEAIIGSLIEGGKAQTREEAIKMLEEAI